MRLDSWRTAMDNAVPSQEKPAMCPNFPIVVLGAMFAMPGGERCQNQEVQFAPAAGSPFTVGPMAGRPVIADMDNDGRPDIVVACGTCCGSPAKPDSGHVAILRSDSNGTFVLTNPKRVIIGPSA